MQAALIFSHEQTHRSGQCFFLGPENRHLATAVERLLLGRQPLGVLVVGGPQSGKSTLLQFVKHSACKLGWKVEPSLPWVLQPVGPEQDCLLLLDDLDRQLQGKTLNEQLLARLVDHCPKILMTTTRPPRQLKLAPPTLDRLQQLAAVELQDPGPETRFLLLRCFASRHGVSLTDAQVQRLAEQWVLPAGVLETQLLNLIRGFVPQPHHAPTPLSAPASPKQRLLQVARTTARFYKIPLQQLRGDSRQRRVVHARRMAMFLSRRHLSATLDQIGEVFGGKDHTTVLYHCRQFQRLLRRDAQVRAELRQLERLLGLTKLPQLAAS